MLLDFIIASTASQITFSLTLHKIGCGLAKRYKAANCFLAFALALRYLCIKLWLGGEPLTPYDIFLKGLEPKISKILAIVCNLDDEDGVCYVLFDENEIENLNPTAIFVLCKER